jgi:hypothetical protein
MANVGRACGGWWARALPLQRRSDRNSQPVGTAVRAAGAHRWLANAEADHSGGVALAEGGTHRLGAGAVAAKTVTLADRDVDEGARRGKDGVRRQDPLATGPQPADTSYRGTLTIDVVANDAVEMPPSLLAASEQTSGWPASALVTL